LIILNVTNVYVSSFENIKQKSLLTLRTK